MYALLDETLGRAQPCTAKELPVYPSSAHIFFQQCIHKLMYCDKVYDKVYTLKKEANAIRACAVGDDN